MIDRRFLLKSFLATAFPYSLMIDEAVASDSADVIVVGAGAAGLAAAARASELGAKVILLEQNRAPGGSSLISGGFLGVVDPKRQEPLGIKDSAEQHFLNIWESGGKIADKELIRVLVKESPRMLAWIESKGVKFQNTVIEIYGSHFPRCHMPVLPNGSAYIRGLSAASMANKTEIITNAFVSDLLFDATDSVTGVKVLIQGKERVLIAKKGVILTAGGFGANKDMVAKYDPRLKGFPSNTQPKADGKLLNKCIEHGLDVVDMNQIQCLPGPPAGGKIRVRLHNDVSRFILVDLQGNRFVDERLGRDVLRDKVIALPEKCCFCITDDAGLKSYDLLMQRDAIRGVETGDAFKAKTLEELAIKIGVSPENLVRAVKERNEEAKKDRAPNQRIAIQKPPYWACPTVMRIHYTMGGLKIDTSARCLRKGVPVSNLYAAGEITGGVHGQNRIGANGLVDAMTFGMIAGESVLGKAV